MSGRSADLQTCGAGLASFRAGVQGCSRDGCTTTGMGSFGAGAQGSSRDGCTTTGGSSVACGTRTPQRCPGHPSEVQKPVPDGDDAVDLSSLFAGRGGIAGGPSGPDRGDVGSREIAGRTARRRVSEPRGPGGVWSGFPGRAAGPRGSAPDWSDPRARRGGRLNRRSAISDGECAPATPGADTQDRDGRVGRSGKIASGRRTARMGP
jgi:hypothetical protein